MLVRGTQPCGPKAHKSVSPDFLPPAACDFPTRHSENGHFQGIRLKIVVFPASRRRNCMSQGVENRDSLVNVPLALRGKCSCKGTVTACFALTALIVWKYLLDSTLRKLSVHQVRLQWYGNKGHSSHSWHCSGDLFPQCCGGSPVGKAT